MSAPTYTNTLSNGNTADASQVMQNFTDILNGITDGSKDLTINALTCSGIVALNGTVTLGDSSTDDLTINGSLASSIVIKTTNLYDLGGSTIGLRSVYFSSADGAARTTRVKGATVASSYTITLPTSAGTTGMGFNTNGSGTLDFRYPDKVLASQTGTYTGTGDEVVIPCNATGGGFTVNLPAAASYTNKKFKIIKTDSSFNAVTVDGNASETINGATTTTLNTQYECITVVCDGSNWHITDRRIPSVWTAYTPTGTWVANTTYSGLWRRVGDTIEVAAKVLATGAPTSANLTIDLPTGLTIDTAKLPGTTSSEQRNFGLVTIFDTSASGRFVGGVLYTSTTAVAIAVHDDVAGGVGTGFNVDQATPMTFANGDIVYAKFSVPISTWNG